jgi:cytochrome c oxidase subunit 4
VIETTNTSAPHPPLVGIFLALIALLAATVAFATRDLGPFAVPVMLTIALAKAALIVLYFMHARYAGWLTWVVVATALVWMAILVVTTLLDYWSRGWMPIPDGWMP